MTNEIRRLVAYKTKISDLVNGKYFKEEGWASNYVLTEGGKKLSRINVLGIVVAKNPDLNEDYSEVLVDDGSAKIGLRSFEKNEFVENARIGDVVLVVGRPREFGNEKYILIEIFKTLNDNKWMELRKLELEIEENAKKNVTEENEELIGGAIEETTADSKTSVVSIIKNLDKGDGADYDEVVFNSKNRSCDKVIEQLLKQGDIFEIRAGKLKVLE